MTHQQRVDALERVRKNISGRIDGLLATGAATHQDVELLSKLCGDLERLRWMDREERSRAAEEASQVHGPVTTKHYNRP